MEPRILDEKIISQHGSCLFHIKRWLAGVYPERGQIIQGYTGWETEEDIWVIRPQNKFYVED